MSIWELRQHIESAIPAWLPFAIPVVATFIYGFYEFTRRKP